MDKFSDVTPFAGPRRSSSSFFFVFASSSSSSSSPLGEMEWRPVGAGSVGSIPASVVPSTVECCTEGRAVEV